MTSSVTDEWTNSNITNGKGFGYSLDDPNATDAVPAFTYDEVAGTCTGTYCAKQFASAEDSESAVSIFSDAGPADNDNIQVCYKIVAGTTTAAGNYENYVTYNATATF